MNVTNVEVFQRILSVTETGLEAVEYMMSLEQSEVDISFEMALNVLEMLFEVQKSLIIFQHEVWWGEVSTTIQSVINLFGELTEFYEKRELKIYTEKMNEIYHQYIEFRGILNKY